MTSHSTRNPQPAAWSPNQSRRAPESASVSASPRRAQPKVRSDRLTRSDWGYSATLESRLSNVERSLLQRRGTAGRIVGAVQIRGADCRFKEPDVRRSISWPAASIHNQVDDRARRRSPHGARSLPTAQLGCCGRRDQGGPHACVVRDRVIDGVRALRRVRRVRGSPDSDRSRCRGGRKPDLRCERMPVPAHPACRVGRR